jgi:5-methylcytosine-specific restriction protein B
MSRLRETSSICCACASALISSIENLRMVAGLEVSSVGKNNNWELKTVDEFWDFARWLSGVAEQAGQATPADLDLSTRNFFKMSLGAVDEEDEVYRAAIDGG